MPHIDWPEWRLVKGRVIRRGTEHISCWVLWLSFCFWNTEGSELIPYPHRDVDCSIKLILIQKLSTGKLYLMNPPGREKLRKFIDQNLTTMSHLFGNCVICSRSISAKSSAWLGGLYQTPTVISPLFLTPFILTQRASRLHQAPIPDTVIGAETLHHFNGPATL